MLAPTIPATSFKASAAFVQAVLLFRLRRNFAEPFAASSLVPCHASGNRQEPFGGLKISLKLLLLARVALLRRAVLVNMLNKPALLPHQLRASVHEELTE